MEVLDRFDLTLALSVDFSMSPIYWFEAELQTLDICRNLKHAWVFFVNGLKEFIEAFVVNVL